MALDCGPHIWNSCINSKAATCETDDPAFEGTMEINTPDPSTGVFDGWFIPKGGGPRQTLNGTCSNQKPHMVVEREDGGDTHHYEGEKSADQVKGKHKKSKKDSNRKQDDDVWTGTKVGTLPDQPPRTR